MFALAVDPGNREHVLAATTLGLYQRRPSTDDAFEWTQQRPEVHSSIVVASDGAASPGFSPPSGVKAFSIRAMGKLGNELGPDFPALTLVASR